jgi:Flp pilus assembly protein TadB
MELRRNLGSFLDEVRLKSERFLLQRAGKPIALLVPVSLGLLSLFPGYTDVLFNTTIGNLVLVVAGVLELLGAVLVARLVRIEV